MQISQSNLINLSSKSINGFSIIFPFQVIFTIAMLAGLITYAITFRKTIILNNPILFTFTNIASTTINDGMAFIIDILAQMSIVIIFLVSFIIIFDLLI